jgi:hypothetical protein
VPNTVTIDKVDILKVTLYKTPDGDFRAFAEYHLKSGGQLIQPAARDVTAQLSAARKVAATAVLDGIAQDIASAELG